VAALPGRKIILCISPGWPLISGPRIDLNATQQQHIMGNIVAFSTQLRQANVTLYDINPYGPVENEIQSNYYRAFLKGVSKPYQTDLADLSLQVLAIHSGGLVLQGSTDIAGMINKCIADTDSWYRITFAPAVAEHPNEFHQIEVKLDKPGLTARTRDGYYIQPQAVSSPAGDKTQYR
jgi:VWFA-related protein